SLSWFHRKVGPVVYFSYPERLLSEDLSMRIANIMDQAVNEGPFTHSFENLISMNYYFEIFSKFARGQKEMLLLTVIKPSSDINANMEKKILSHCKEFSERLKSNEEIYTAFYINDINNYSEEIQDKIVKNDSMIKLLVKEFYWEIVEETREKTEEEKIAELMNQKHIFLTLEKLANGPIKLEGLQEWFGKNFPNKDFEKMKTTLVDKQFIFINEIGRVQKYVLLLKEVNAERIPPDSVIEYIDDKPELIELLLPKVQEYFSQYVNKEDAELKKDSFTLFQIMADSKKYNVLSELRNDIILRNKLPKLVSKSTLESLIENIKFLKQMDVIEELNVNNETYVVLKTNIRITTSFPEYLRKLLPKDSYYGESKHVIADKYTPVITTLERRRKEVANIFKDVRDKEPISVHESQDKISSFLEDLSSNSKKKTKQKNK
ncbi:MAG: hypothetical protein ACOC44_02505, partial [Promethearchaeia archaeon]